MSTASIATGFSSHSNQSNDLHGSGVSDDCLVSVVIPVYNEEEIITGSTDEIYSGLIDVMRSIGVDVGATFEIILAENGSSDNTARIGTDLANRYKEVRLIQSSVPTYGAALKQGILTARGRYVICDEIDLGDMDFYRSALKRLIQQQADMIVGSKCMVGAHDNRPLFRIFATKAYNRSLKVLFRYPGTDTHGLKAFRRAAVLPIVEACVIDRDVFASELVIRCYRSGIKVKEIPLDIKEKRKPSISLIRRVPGVLSNLGELFQAIKPWRPPEA